MYLDLIIIVLLLLAVFVYFRRWSNFVYAVAMIDIFLRILAFLRDNVPVPEFKNLLSKYFASSIPAIFAKYTNGVFYTILMWILVIIYICFLYYVFLTFKKRRK